jgi:LysM repeat protein
MKSLCKYSIIVIISIIFPITSLLAVNNSSASRKHQVQTLTLLRDNEKQLTILSSRVKYLVDNYATLTQQIKQLKQSQAIEKQNNIKLKQEISAFKKHLSRDKKQMQKSLDNIIDKVANETTKAINTAIKTTNRTSYDKTKNDGPIGTGKFIEYKVQSGATLNAIAKAYNVSVTSIRKANKMKNDFIRTGQILYIPKQ